MNSPKKQLLSIIIVGVLLIFVSVTFSEQIQEFVGIENHHKKIRVINKKSFSDETKLKSKIVKLKHCIKKNHSNQFLNLLAADFEDTLGTIKGKLYAKQLFKTCFLDFSLDDRDDYSKRRMPKIKNISSNWDFEIDIKDIDIKKNQKKAQAICNIYFKFDQPDIELETELPDFLLSEKEINKKIKDNKQKDDKLIDKEKKPKHTDITIDFKFKDGEWQIKKIDNLFKFVDERNKKLSKEKYGYAQ